jgi:hypothetical protein
VGALASSILVAHDESNILSSLDSGSNSTYLRCLQAVMISRVHTSTSILYNKLVSSNKKVVDEDVHK